MKKLRTIEELESCYGSASATSLAKVSPHLTPEYQQILQASPFCTIATVGPEGLDCSPRGDGPGFVHIIDKKTLALPDRRGNNRLDSLRNIVRTPTLSLLFLVPGLNETLRVNGEGFVTTDEVLRNTLSIGGKLPATIIVVDIKEVYFQCARALIRSDLWNPANQIDPKKLPSAGQLTKSVISEFDAKKYDAELPSRQRTTLY